MQLRRIFSRFSLSFLILAVGILFVKNVFSPSTVFAANGAFRVGTHLAQGDYNAQLKVIEFIKSKNPSPGYPVTVLLDIGATSSQIQKLSDALSPADFKVNLRVTGITTATTKSIIDALANELNNTTWKTSSKPIVILGNELNALAPQEWGDQFPAPANVTSAGVFYGPLLVELSDTLNDTYDVAGVALDPYHKNSAVTFVQSAGGAFQHAGVNAFATNIYDGVSGPNGEGLDAWISLLKAAGAKQRRIYTEFGINPQDHDPQHHIDFYKKYETTPLPGDFESATALIPNLCDVNINAANQWYYYVVGKIYNSSLQEIDAGCKPIVSNNTFIYPAPDDRYRKTKDIEMLKTGLSQYMMSCAPLINFRPLISPSNPKIPVVENGVKGLLDLAEFCGNPDNQRDFKCVFNPVDQTVTVNADNATLPLVRSASQGRTSSFEGFFTSDITNPLYGSDPRLSAPYSKMMSRQAVCAQNVQFLVAVKQTCDILHGQQGEL